MLDFFRVSTRTDSKGRTVVYPRFRITKSKDLMIRGGDFYAIWLDEQGRWSTDEQDALDLIDAEIDKYLAEKNIEHGAIVLYMCDAESNMIDAWHRYCQRQMRDSFHPLDETLVFANSPVKKEDYASKRLPYPLENAPTPAFDQMIHTLYDDEEAHKLMWAIGAIVSGDSKRIQKFMVLYGAQGTGKSTILNIVEQLFQGYYSVFDAKALGSSSNQFALEAFKSNPLVAIQHDGDLSRIEDNTRLNSLVSHEKMTVNEKFKSTYATDFKCFLFMGTNKPVKITDAKSGLIRRLIDVSPSGRLLNRADYDRLKGMIPFELGGIANECLNVYLDDKHAYDDYIPIGMMGASNDFYNFVMDSYLIFSKENGVSLKIAWEMYKNYCEYAKVAYPFPQRVFKEELKNYFDEYLDKYTLADGTNARGYYKGFRGDRYESNDTSITEPAQNGSKTLILDSNISIFDKTCADCYAQYASEEGAPRSKWGNVTTKLSDIDTSLLHYVLFSDIHHIVIDFDLKVDGKKSLEANLAEAAKWPATYAELSKSGCGVHLHYIYTGDPTKLSRIYSENVEIKVFTGKQALRRKLTKCNNLPIANISSGLPLKGDDKVVNQDTIKNEKAIRTLILRNLEKEYHPGTKPSIDFIYKILDDAYKAGTQYDVRDLRNAVLAFAAGSTNHADYCIKMVNKMQFKSADELVLDNAELKDEKSIVFYDVEVFPNLFVVCFMSDDSDEVSALINPTAEDINKLTSTKLVGFNNRNYDNHILYARMLGYDNEQIYQQSQLIIGNHKDGKFREAYNLSYTDIYDFASAGNKMSLKKLEIKMGIHHQELGLPWDKPVPEELWPKVVKYCKNDVKATKAAFHHLEADWTAREILADLAEMTVNDSTNSLTTRIIFGTNRKPQNEFCYRNLAEPVTCMDPEVEAFLKEACPEMMSKKHYGYEGSGDKRESLLPYFPGYEFKFGKSTYRGEVVGEGGWVFAKPDAYGNVALLDISSMHPHSAIAECLFGPRFTRAFRDIVEGRVSIKHEAWDIVNGMLDGKLTPYIQKVLSGEMTSGSLANALKTAINSVYGLTSAKFENPFKDARNIDNIVAKRGALFMVNLKNEVEARGFKVAHIKTDSIKIPDATPEIIDFVYNYGLSYGYTFEHEATYEKMCLVNNAVYIAKYATEEKCMSLYGYCPGKNHKKSGEWTATGTQFAVPYVFKTLFSKEEIAFEDMCETKECRGSIYLDMCEGLPEGEHNYIFVGKVGLFCPMQEGVGAGKLYREADGKYYSIGGTKDYLWMETEQVEQLGLQDKIDKSYYIKLVNDAIESISLYCDAGWFASDEGYFGEIPGALPF